jgi:hypothetical protein
MQHTLAQQALRARLLTLSFGHSDGNHNVSATGTGFARVHGSWLNSGYAVGMEVTASGFTTPANNGVFLVTGVTATTLTTKQATVIEGPTAHQTLDILLPTRRAWEGVDYVPSDGFPFVQERYLAGPTTLVTISAAGELESTPSYSITFTVAAGYGMEAANRYADACLALFRPGTTLTMADGATLRVRSDTGPFRAPMIQDGAGWQSVVVTIPCRAYTPNT